MSIKVEPNELQKLYKSRMKLFKGLNRDLVRAIYTAMNEGKTPEASVKLAFQETKFGAVQRGIVADSCAMACRMPFLGTQLDIDFGKVRHWFMYKNWGGGVKLSEALHTTGMQREIRGILDNYMQVKKDIYDYKRVLRTVDSFDKVPKELGSLFEQMRSTGAASDDVVQKASRYIDGLSGRGASELRAGYSKSVDMVMNGAPLEKAIQSAIKSKVEYVQQRIMRTEFARAYDVGFQRKVMEDDDVIGFRSVLSTGHPIEDICDHYAEVDAYNMGGGVYPKSAACHIPYHPNCLCMKEEVYAGEVKVGRYSEKRVEDYLTNLPEQKKKRIVGAGNAEAGRYLQSVEKQGFRPNEARIDMIPKEFIKGADE